jgi:hypothetical protein
MALAVADGASTEPVTLDRLLLEVAYLRAAILEATQAQYVTRAEFAPIRMLVYGLVGLILSGFIGGVLALVWKGR